MQQSSRNGTKFGAYTLNRLIARGGMGEVYEAYESKLERRVALKLIAPTDPNEHDQDELIRRFMTEARTLAKVNHPNIVTIFSIDNIVDVPFIAMEYVDGVAFRDLIEQFTFTADGAAPLFLQICEGVKCLHDNQIIHRDLKPHNILLRRDGQVKILDFGIAKAQGAAGNDQTRAGVVVGTLPYMPPEIKTGAPASPRSDIWSLGAIFFECLTGDRLVSAQAEAPKGVEVPFNAAEVARIPAEMRAIITKMCAARPAQRFQAIGEVMEELRKFRQNRPPVPASTWDVLTQKVDEIAAASRQLADTEEPRVKFTQLLAKQHLDQPASGEIRDITGERQRAQLARANNTHDPVVSRVPRRGIVIGLALLLGGAFVYKVHHDANHARPAPAPAATPVVPVLPTAAPAAPESPAPAPPATLTPAPTVALEPPTLTDPADNQTQWLEPDQVPTFAWSRLVDAGEYRFELAGDRDFKDMRVSEPVAGGSYRPARPLDAGSYYWRLNAVKRELKSTPPSRLTVNLLQPVTLTAPEDQERVIAKSKDEGASLKFRWSCPSNVKQYHLEISAFGNPKPLIDQTVAACEVTLRKIGAGNFRWRVRPESSGEAPRAPWSESRAFTVEAATSSAPARDREREREPEHERPAPAKLARNALPEPRVTEPDVTAAAGRAATLRWDKVKAARGYRVQISDAANFNRPLVDEKTAGPSFTWRHPAAGRHFWRVAAFNGAEQSAFSDRGTIDTSVPAPVLNNAYRVATPTLDFPAVNGAERYLIQVSRNRDLAGAQSQVSARPRAILDESGGTFYVRVAAANAAGEAISSFSSLAQVEVEKPFLLNAPALLTPPKHAHAPSRGGRISIIFSWDRSPNADQYVLEISNDEKFRKVIERKVTAERGAVYKQVELSGRVYWRVRAKSAAGQSDWSKPNYFDVVN